MKSYRQFTLNFENDNKICSIQLRDICKIVLKAPEMTNQISKLIAHVVSTIDSEEAVQQHSHHTHHSRSTHSRNNDNLENDFNNMALNQNEEGNELTGVTPSISTYSNHLWKDSVKDEQNLYEEE